MIISHVFMYVFMQMPVVFACLLVFFMTSHRETETVSLEFKQLHESFQSFAQHDVIFLYICTYVSMYAHTYLCLQGTTIKMFTTLNIK